MQAFEDIKRQVSESYRAQERHSGAENDNTDNPQN